MTAKKSSRGDGGRTLSHFLGGGLFALFLLAPWAARAQVFVSTGATTGLRMYGPNISDWWLNPLSGSLNFLVGGNASAPVVSFLSGGNVGVGTASPAAALDVSGVARETSLAANGWGSGSGLSGIHLFAGVYQSTADIIAYNYPSGPYKDLALQNNAVYIQAGGNVGIGTTNPIAKLDITSGQNILVEGGTIFISTAAGVTNGMILQPTDIGTNFDQNWTFRQNGQDRARFQSGDGSLCIGSACTPGSVSRLAVQAQSGDAYALYVASNNLTTAYLTVNAGNGNVGVGMAPSSQILAVNGSGVSSVGILTGGYQFGVFNSGSGDFTIGSDASNVYMQSWATKPLQINNQGNNIILDYGGGSVGIGTNGPGSKLTVFNGDIRISTSAGSNGLIFQDGTKQTTAASGSTAPTRTVLTSGAAATYNTPANAKQLKIRMVGGGGGGGGAHTGASAGGAGSDTIFNGVHAAGGGGGDTAGNGGYGGSNGTGSASFRVGGSTATTSVGAPVSGASSALGGGGGGVYNGTQGNGRDGSTNSGSGGGSCVWNGGSPPYSGAGGAGEYVELVIASPAASYTYTVGSGGTQGNGSCKGGNGAAGLIIIDESY